VASGMVTHAVRNTTMNGFKLKEGDIIGLDNKRILAKGDNIDDCTIALIKALKRDDHEMITLYYGEGVTEEEAQALVGKVSETYPDCDVDVGRITAKSIMRSKHSSYVLLRFAWSKVSRAASILSLSSSTMLFSRGNLLVFIIPL